MPVTTIRICEEPEARMMLKDGSFRDWLQLWFDRFPQQKRPTPAELRPWFNCGSIREILQIHSEYVNEIRLEIGGKALFRRMFGDSWSLYVKVGDLWVERNYDDNELSEGDLFPKKPHVKEICGEKELMKADIRELSRSIVRKSRGFHPLETYRFGDHELWTVDRWGGTVAHAYSEDLKCSSVLLDEMDVARHIEKYRAAHKKVFGAF